MEPRPDSNSTHPISLVLVIQNLHVCWNVFASCLLDMQRPVITVLFDVWYVNVNVGYGRPLPIDFIRWT